MPLLGDHGVAAEELAGRFAAGLIPRSPGAARRRLGSFKDPSNYTLRLVNS